MTRDGFMKELAYLLQDIQDEDKEDALQYYMDYFDEAAAIELMTRSTARVNTRMMMLFLK